METLAPEERTGAEDREEYTKDEGEIGKEEEDEARKGARPSRLR